MRNAWRNPQKWPSLNPRINDHLMIQQRSLLQSDSREVHVGHYHLFFTRASRSKLSLANFRIESTEKKTRAVLQSSNFPLGYLSTSGPPSHPLLAYLTQSAHTMLWSHQFHIFLQGLQAPTCTAQGAPPKFSPRQHGMTQLISSWNSANLWCFSIHFWQNTLIPCLQFTPQANSMGLYCIQ